MARIRWNWWPGADGPPELESIRVYEPPYTPMNPVIAGLVACGVLVRVLGGLVGCSTLASDRWSGIVSAAFNPRAIRSLGVHGDP